MGKRDYGHRETKKAKKDTKKSPTINILSTPVNVEVVRKSKKREGEEE